MAVDKNLFRKITEYFEEKSELVDSSSFAVYALIRNDSLACFYQNREITGEEPRRFEITLENMLGYLETRKRNMEDLERYAKECASKLYEVGAENIDVEKAYLMTNGSSLPLRVDLTIENKEGRINKTMYIKCFDPTRLLGIELYRLIGETDRRYWFFFNEGIIVEDSQEGEHEFESTERISEREHYKEERIKADLISFYLGLDDLGKKDNYLVASDGKIRIIDFDMMNRVYSDKDIIAIKRQSAEEIGISSEEYDTRYKEEERLLRERVHRKKDRIYQIIGILKSSEDSGIAAIGNYISKNTENLLSKH